MYIYMQHLFMLGKCSGNTCFFFSRLSESLKLPLATVKAHPAKQTSSTYRKKCNERYLVSEGGNSVKEIRKRVSEQLSGRCLYNGS